MTESKRRPLTKAGMGITPGRELNVQAGGIEELRRDVQMLMDIEAIKQLKHAYFRCIDTANIDELGTLFHDEVTVCFTGGGYEWKLQGKAEYLSRVSQAFHCQAIGHHNGHQPEIQILGDSEATGIWYLADQMWLMDMQFYTAGTALYWDRYQKVDGRWLIRDTRYERIYEMSQRLDENPVPSSHYLASYGAKR